jgi:ferredoxin-NADP reductase
MVWRFLTPRDWWRSHPYSLSAAPRDGVLRLTAREIGDGSRMLARLRPGTLVLAEGPYGVLTEAVRTRAKVLLIGAGLGISPIRALLEDLPHAVDTEVVHRASTRDAAVLHGELEALAAGRPLTRVHLVTGRRGRPDDRLRPLGPMHLRALVPDITSRDVYLCGPPGLTQGIVEDLRRLGVPGAQVHLESFEL